MHVHLHPFHVDPAAKNVQVLDIEEADPEAEFQEPEGAVWDWSPGARTRTRVETDLANPDLQQGKHQNHFHPESYIH